ncbi:UNVERIFIED_CONTAM: Sperm flagellar protein 2, partial [Siphonaria sp. JEL0065]
MEKSHLEEHLLTKLMRQSKQERRIAEGLMQIRLERDFMCENRMHREEQFAKRRQKDYEEALDREFVLAERAREEYKRQTTLQFAQYFEILAIKAGEKHIKNANVCKEIIHQIVDLSFKFNESTNFDCQISEYRELNDYDDEPPNPNMLRQWKIFFIKGQPLLKSYNLNLEQDK